MCALVITTTQQVHNFDYVFWTMLFGGDDDTFKKILLHYVQNEVFRH